MRYNELNLMTPEQRFVSWWKNLDSRVKLTFFAAMLWGLVCHGMMLTNKYSAHDDVAFMHTVGATFDSGRWMLGLLSLAEQALTGVSHYSMPLPHGLISLGCLALCLLLVLFPLMWCRYDNAMYMDLEISQQRTVSWFNTLITRIKSTERYRDELPIAYIGRMEKSDLTLGAVSRIQYIWPYENATDLINDAAQIQFMDKWCGFWQQMTEFEHPDIEAMPCYPDDGSIRIIDDVIVVKFQPVSE